MIDLHVHSIYSDGTCSPAELVDRAMHAGLHAIGLTDHDTVEGNTEFLAAAAAASIDAIAGVEISAEYINPVSGRKGDGELHILGYFPEWTECNEQAMNDLEEIRENRSERNPKIIRRLNDLGCDITIEEVNAYAGNQVVGRPHIAALLVQKGYAANTEQAFTRYLSSSAPAYVPKKIFPPERAIRLIRDAGGLPVLAHPKMLQIHSEPHMRDLLDSLTALGLEGIEAHCSTHQPYDVQRFSGHAEEYGLVVTGGTDFHGDNKPDIRIGSGFGNVHVPDTCIERIRTRMQRIKDQNTTGDA
jgi:predicted metal-dependent phosphoesterase TrpH